jgi:hypothetical protein
MLVELIQNFIGGSEATLNSLFKSMLNLVFFIERELGNIQLSNGNYINFNTIYEVIFNYAIFILVIVFIKKAISIYFLLQESDAEESPLTLVVGMMKAIIVMICFKELYGIFVSVTGEFLDSIISVMSMDMSNLSEMLSKNIQRRNIYSHNLLGATHNVVDANMSIYNERY